MTILARDLPRFHGRRAPNAVALRDGDTGASYTWAELDDRSARMARALAERFGVRSGDRVCLITDNVPQVFELQFACR